MGEGPKRLSRVQALRGKLPVVIRKGQTRPESALIASKFARECNNALRTGVPVRSHWNKYKGDNGLLDNYYNEVAVSTYCRHLLPCKIYIKMLISGDINLI